MKHKAYNIRHDFQKQKKVSSFKFRVPGSPGFMILEFLVAVGVFTVLITISLSVLLSMFDAQRKAVSLQNTQDNIRFAFEHMTKEIRTGRLFHCDQNQNVVNPENPKDCPYSNGGKSFSFLSLPSGDTVTYQVVNNQLVKSLTGNRPCWNSGVDMTPGLNCQILTSPEVVIINDINFYVDGATDDGQPRIMIILDAQTTDPTGSTRFTVQTTVSQNYLDNS